MQKENLGFNLLKALQKCLVERRGAARAFAGVDKSAGVPRGFVEIANDFCQNFFLGMSFCNVDRALGDLEETTDAPLPGGTNTSRFHNPVRVDA